MAYDITGKVKLVQEAQTFNSGFTKREVVITVEDERYPQDICLEFVQERVNLLDNIQAGQEVTISFDIRGREYNGRYFNNLHGWRIQTLPEIPSKEEPPAASEGSVPDNLDEYEDDIPF